MADIDRQRMEARLRERAGDLARTRTTPQRGRSAIAEGDLSPTETPPADGAAEARDAHLELAADARLGEKRRETGAASDVREDGVCADCRGRISAARLRAVPEAVRCVDCQRSFEDDHRRSSESATPRLSR